METETKTCKRCEADFVIGSGEKSMYGELEMPPPKDCFKCRVQQKLAFWVFGKFRKGKSDLNGESFITTLPEKTRFPVYTSQEWFSDAWEPVSADYDSKQPFFEQFKNLQEKIPRPHQLGKNNIGCEWCDDVWDSKNCYLSRSMVGCEHLSYGYRNFRVRDSLDATYCFTSEKIYDSTYGFNNHKVFYSFDSRDSVESRFLYDCRNVQHCFMCWNLRSKQYYIKNRPYTKEEYFAKLKQYNFGSWLTIQKLKEKFSAFIREEVVHKENFNTKVVNSTGNLLTNCKNCKNCFYYENSEDNFDSFRGFADKSSIDLVGCLDTEHSGGTAGSTEGYDLKYSLNSIDCRFSMYLDNCIDCEYCFGCVGLRNKNYCILNKQYAEEEYRKLRDKIIASMEKDGTFGEFLPYGMALTGYNLSLAHIYFPETREKIFSWGGLWDEVKDAAAEGMTTAKLPDDINDVSENITLQPLICPETGYRFNIAPHELEFYREMKIPLPRFHPDWRTLNRFKKIAVVKPYPRQCVFCGKEIQAYYLPEWGYKKIACEACYQKEIL